MSRMEQNGENRTADRAVRKDRAEERMKPEDATQAVETDGTLRIVETFDPEETWRLGYELGQKSVPGSVYTLNGDLGTGKTVFTQGFAAGLGIAEPVSSPTFTILQEYTEGRLPLYHFDVYRIGDPEEMDEIGFDEYVEGDGVCLIEWAGLIAHILPPKVTDITIEKDLEKGFNYRRIIIK